MESDSNTQCLDNAVNNGDLNLIRIGGVEFEVGELVMGILMGIDAVISDKIISEDEFVEMQRWLSRLRESKDFDSDKKAKLQEVLKEWIDDNIA